MLKILFDAKEYKFLSAEGAKTFGRDFVEGNGWICEIKSDGSIYCECVEIKDGKCLKTFFNINNRGWCTLSKYKHGKKFYRIRFFIKGWPIDGQLVFGDGTFEERNVIFYGDNYVSERWKNTHGISEINFDNPNRIYSLGFYYLEEEKQFGIEHIETDGKVDLIDEDFGITLDWQEMYPNSSTFEHYKKVLVTDATWVIITKISTMESSRILYSLIPTFLLENLPEGPKNNDEEDS